VRGYKDLRLALGAAALCALIALAMPLTALSLLFAAPLTLFLPGYAITEAVFARRKLRRPQALVLSLALSLVTLVGGALLLNYAPGGVRPVSWGLLLALVVLVACRVAAVRRPPATAGGAWRRPSLRRRDAGLAAGGLLLAAIAIVLSMTTLPASNARGYTQLWLLPALGSVRTEAKIGVRSEEQQTTDFDLRVKIGAGEGASIGAGLEVVRRSFRLKPGEGRVIRVGPTSAPAGTKVPVVAALLRHDNPYKVYRRVRGWLTAGTAR
jgi:hypothetical protein